MSPLLTVGLPLGLHVTDQDSVTPRDGAIVM